MHFTSGQLSKFEAYIYAFAAVITALTYSGKSDDTVRGVQLLTRAFGGIPLDLGVRVQMLPYNQEAFSWPRLFPLKTCSIESVVI